MAHVAMLFSKLGISIIQFYQMEERCTCCESTCHQRWNYIIAFLKCRFERFVKIIADCGYCGELIEKTKPTFG